MGDPKYEVDWHTYYDAAQKCLDLAAELRIADKPLHDDVKGQCAGMAGDAPGCKQWGEAYDKHAEAIMQLCTNLADALTNFGYLLRALGYIHGKANNGQPDRPYIVEMSVHDVQIPTSVADNGNGLRHDGGGVGAFFDELVWKVTAKFGKLPNGDIDKLATAGTTWDTFGKHQAVLNAASRIAAIADLLAGLDEPVTAQRIADHFGTLKAGAQRLVESAPYMGGLVTNYRTATIDVSELVVTEVEGLLYEIGITIGISVAVSWLSFGGSLAAGTTAVGNLVLRTLKAIEDAYAISELAEVLGLVMLADGAAGDTKEFNMLPDVGPITAELAAIISKPALIFEPSSKHGPKQRGKAAPEPTNPQHTLDNSVRFSDETTRRVGYDPTTGEFAIFDMTFDQTGIYHGHKRTWEQLSEEQQNGLVNAGIVDKKGKPR
ncbi:hypothetical protein [Nocardia carnea]|uniref:Uncharacterized protein n=1 Tax=Nocardia carnea TaxID=37328 RepID=A0ABW7TJL9_9NOCA|nr:hypothetical protein [Nocardia carnea]